MKQTQREKTVLLILAALFTAIISVCAQIQIPTPFFTLTLQTFAVALCGYTLGVKYSLLSVVAYILLGIAGAPIFSGFCGGFHDIVEPQGGFIIAFPILAAVCGLSVKFKKNSRKILLGFAGVTAMYTFGVCYFVLMFADKSSIGIVALAFLGAYIKDMLLCIAALYISNVIRKRIMKIGTVYASCHKDFFA